MGSVHYDSSAGTNCSSTRGPEIARSCEIGNPTEHLGRTLASWSRTIRVPPLARMLRATLRRAVGHGAEAASLGLRLAPRWHGLSTVATMRSATVATKRTLSLGLRLAPRCGLSTVATKRTLTLEEAMPPGKPPSALCHLPGAAHAGQSDPGAPVAPHTRPAAPVGTPTSRGQQWRARRG